jgi:hypothetical protein
MKSSYTVPKLTVHGNVAEITQVLGNKTTRKDFVFLNGEVVSNRNDMDSMDLDCTGSLSKLTCTPK